MLGWVPILLKHVSQKLMSLYSISKVPIPVNMDTYLGNIPEYLQVHDPCPYIAVLLN